MSGTGPTTDHTTGGQNGHYLYLETSSPSKPGDVAILWSPVQSTSNIGGSRCLTFFYHMYGSRKLKLIRCERAQKYNEQSTMYKVQKYNMIANRFCSEHGFVKTLELKYLISRQAPAVYSCCWLMKNIVTKDARKYGKFRLNTSVSHECDMICVRSATWIWFRKALRRTQSTQSKKGSKSLRE